MRLNPPGDAGEPGVYGTQGVPAANNVPGGRYGGTVSWIDSTGNLWLFGGTGFDSTGAYGELNDLWEFNPTAKTWTWVSGSSTANAVGVCGNMGVAAASDVPGARSGAVGWIDRSGSLWLFGGTGTGYTTSDLWEFSPTTKMWTWVNGSSTENAVAVYGTLGTASSSNTPGGRYGDVSWTDSSGNLWLFGGVYISNGSDYENLGDLWRYDPSQSSAGKALVQRNHHVTNSTSQARKETQMKRATLITAVLLGIATILFAQQQQYRREHMICPIDGARMDWTGNQQGSGNNASCEFSHVAFTADRQRADHKAWASCTEWR